MVKKICNKILGLLLQKVKLWLERLFISLTAQHVCMPTECQFWYTWQRSWMKNYLELQVNQKWCKIRELCLQSTSVVTYSSQWLNRILLECSDNNSDKWLTSSRLCFNYFFSLSIFLKVWLWAMFTYETLSIIIPSTYNHQNNKIFVEILAPRPYIHA